MIFYLLYLINKLTDEIDELERGPKISKRQRKLYEARDMARWKAWKEKQKENKNV